MNFWRAFALVCLSHGSFGSHVIAQTFNKRYELFGQGLYQQALSVERSSSGGYLLVGGTLFVSPDSLSYDCVFTQHIDDQGNQLSEQLFLRPQHALSAGWMNSMQPTTDGAYAFAGTVVSQTITKRAVLLKVSAVGDSLFSIEYGNTGDEWIGQHTKQTTAGGFIVAGTTSTTGVIDAFLLKLDSFGNVHWVQTYGDPLLWEFGLTVELVSDGGYVVGGQRKVSQNNFDQWIMRTDSLGNMIWEAQYGSPFNDDAVANLQAISDGNFIMASSWGILNDSQGFPVLMKFDTAGTVLWAQQHGAYGTLRVVKECPNQDLIAAGRVFPGWPTYGPLGALLRTNSVGDSLWMRYFYYQDTLMTDGLGEFMDVVPTDDGGFIAVGTAYWSLSGNNPPGLSQDVWIVKVDSMGCLVPGCHLVTGISAQITNHRNALSVAPNPASSTARLTWQLPGTITGKGNARLSVVSTEGRLLSEVPIDLGSGSHALDVRDLPPGLYWLHVVAEGSWVMGAKLVVD